MEVIKSAETVPTSPVAAYLPETELSDTVLNVKDIELPKMGSVPRGAEHPYKSVAATVAHNKNFSEHLLTDEILEH